MPVKKASVVFGIPRTTLIRRLKSSKVATSLGRFSPVFTAELENELVMHIVEMQNRFYGLSVQDLRSIAYELAVRNGVKHPFLDQQKLAVLTGPRVLRRIIQNLLWENPKLPALVVWLASARCRLNFLICCTPKRRPRNMHQSRYLTLTKVVSQLFRHPVKSRHVNGSNKLEGLSVLSEELPLQLCVPCQLMAFTFH